jgi:hypothetical protein
MKAFPSNGFYERTTGGEQPQKLNPVMGMDLRDYFAAKAMQKIIWKKGEEAEDAKDCYVIADAMMKAREKN